MPAITTTTVRILWFVLMLVFQYSINTICSQRLGGWGAWRASTGSGGTVSRRSMAAANSELPQVVVVLSVAGEGRWWVASDHMELPLAALAAASG